MAAGLSCTRPGARDGLPDRASVLARLRAEHDSAIDDSGTKSSRTSAPVAPAAPVRPHREET
ncbi:hypothetical protein BJF79_23535 [Actinomadura sp. CNU-125]|nr:hypothetical protein BJF79_23535 [Actinomadura sp. CNU-125]